MALGNSGSGGNGNGAGLSEVPGSGRKSSHGASGNRYDPADFIVAAQDHQGHSERLWCRVQPLHDRQVDVVLRSKNWPFRTKGDILRWALVRGLKVLMEMEPSCRGFLQQAEAIQGILRDEIYMQEFMRMFDSLEKVISGHIAMNAKSEAIKLVRKTRIEIEKMDGEPYWRQRCVDELNKRFSHLGDIKPRPIGLHQVMPDADEGGEAE